VVIDDFDVEGVTAFESKTNSPLFVDADAPLALPVAFQRFQAILAGGLARRSSKP